LIAAIVTVAFGLLLSPVQAADPPPGLPPAQAAHALETSIRHHRPVAFDANVQVEALTKTRHHDRIMETTSVPLVYAPDQTKPEAVEYFRVVGYHLATLKVLPILPMNIVDTKPQHWAYRHPRVVVTTHEGVLRTENAGHVPAVLIRLSDRKRRWE
jgi:hypothetical protein